MRAVRALSWIELKLFLREPITVVFTLALPPIVLYVLAEVFGNVPTRPVRCTAVSGPSRSTRRRTSVWSSPRWG